jgi:pentatricopeptide repeat protein
MSKDKAEKKKWISESAYYKSLSRGFIQGLENKDWFEAEQLFNELMNKRIKPGLVRIS